MQFHLQILFSALWFFVAFLSSFRRQLNIYIPSNLTFTITGHFITHIVQNNQLHSAKFLLEKLKGVQLVTEFSTFY